jgi:hypothetical protein
MKTVELRLDDDLVGRLSQLTDEEKTDLSKWIRLWLYKNRPRPVWDVISEVSTYAKSHGLTPEILEQLLSEKN